jgi:hypothetical protein
VPDYVKEEMRPLHNIHCRKCNYGFENKRYDTGNIGQIHGIVQILQRKKKSMDGDIKKRQKELPDREFSGVSSIRIPKSFSR